MRSPLLRWFPPSSITAGAALGVIMVAIASCGGADPTGTAPTRDGDDTALPSATTTSTGSVSDSYCNGYSSAYSAWTGNRLTIGEFREEMRALLAKFGTRLPTDGDFGLLSRSNDLVMLLTRALDWKDQTRDVVLDEVELKKAYVQAGEFGLPPIAGVQLVLWADSLAEDCNLKFRHLANRQVFVAPELGEGNCRTDLCWSRDLGRIEYHEFRH